MDMRPIDHLVAAVLDGDDERVLAALDGDPSLAAERTMFGVGVLHAAVATGRHGLVARLCPHGPSELGLAAELGDLGAVEGLLAVDRGSVDAHDARGSRPLHGACYWGRADVVDVLLA